jgi:hypothetical protein
MRAFLDQLRFAFFKRQLSLKDIKFSLGDMFWLFLAICLFLSWWSDHKLMNGQCEEYQRQAWESSSREQLTVKQLNDEIKLTIQLRGDNQKLIRILEENNIRPPY